MTRPEAACAPLDPDNARTALTEACAEVGLDDSGAELIRLGSNAIFRLRSAPVIVRVMRSVEQFADAGREVEVARWLGKSGIPAIRVTDDPQPLKAARRTVTLWVSVSDGVEYGTTSELGAALRALHKLPAPRELELPGLTPFDRASSRITDAATLSPSERDFLTERGIALRSAHAGLKYALPSGPIHGDANVGNLLRDRNGKAVLSDLDDFATGPREWDLIQTAMYFERYGWHTEEEYTAFCASYGFDVMQWQGYGTLADVKEYMMVTWLAQNARPGTKTASELSRRVRTLRTGRGHREWKPF
ncbi:Ser/Thr protein kinase RdoA (MazF antagonist) [Krasilnikovia cinnamomea]|uniref:Ser/Thr protein kinase RdoA (MazF antagonist) n=1 Tax=Krasilnikovia cinnamomea TaxID=349313 RepID=A0A4Q7ZMF4_9ACTN|nr:aminoglycoside phosphotransferase family protein [Krasilnikovia cinnamomea]RZU51535.1 Ser/Thr protein kinase RdoA (MazF antagonist) [Krasilnikovia cinnamomea]